MRKLNTNTFQVPWREIPLLRLLLPFIVGIYLAEVTTFFSASLIWLIVGLFLGLYGLSRASFSFQHRWITGVFLQLFLLLLGAWSAWQYDERNQNTYFDKQLQKENSIIGVVNSNPQEAKEYHKFHLKIQGIVDAQELVVAATGNLLVYVKNIPNDPLAYGDQIVLRGNIQQISSPKNPAVFDYQRYLHFKNIHYHTFIDSTDWRLLKQQQALWIFQQAVVLNQYFLEQLEHYLPTSSSLSIAAAMALGNKTTMEEATKTAYRESGAIHILAVSGLHVGILSEVLLLLLACFYVKSPYWKWIKYVASLLLIWGFVLIVGASDSVVRAGLMFSFINFGRVTRRDIHSLNALAAAAFVILVVDPYAIFQVGFQFSFLAVLGIVLGFKNIYRIWIPNNKIGNFFWELWVMGMSAQLFVLPLSVYYFHQIPTYSLLTGLLVVPFAGIILYGSIALLISSFLSSTIATWMGIGLGCIIDFQNQFIGKIQELPYHLWEELYITWYEIFFLYGIVLSILLVLYTKNLVWIKWALISLIISISLRIYHLPNKLKKQELIVYALPKASLIDFIDGLNLYTWQSDSIAQQTMVFNVDNYRKSLGIEQYKAIPARKKFEADNLLIDPPFIQFGNKRMVVVDSNLILKKAPNKPVTCSYVLLKDNAKTEILTIKNNFAPALIIFDQSNDWRTVRRWKKECTALNIAYYDIKEKGAFMVSAQ